MYPIVQKLTDLFNEALKIHDLSAAEMYHRQLKEYQHMNPMEETPEEMDAGVDSLYTGLDPRQIEYAKELNAQRNMMIDNTNLSMNKMYTVSGAIDPAALQATPGAYISTSKGLSWTTAVKPMAVFREPTQADKDEDKRRHLKLFVHFAKQFAERYPKWTVIPDPADPLHSVHLLMKERGAMIHNLYPSNEMAVYGGPSSWTDPRKELGQPLPIVKINTQEFWGWCVGMEDVPEWMTV